MSIISLLNKLDKTVHVITSDTMVENPIVKKYMHSSSDNINRAAGKDRLNIKASVIYPEPEQTFWSRVIGLGYPTPEPPGFRWCTDRLKIMPMNKFVNERIKESGEIIILLGVRKGESLTRKKTITAREIEGKLLNMHNDIPDAYVYNPITEIPNNLVWEFLLKGDCRSPWGSDMKYLFSLYQGENLGEEKSVLGEVDREKIPVTGNSRFGCWCCTMVKEDGAVGAPAPQKGTVINYDNVTIEHIASQSPSAAVPGFTSENIHTLSNLTLLTNGENDRAKNKSYTAKKAIYHDSEYVINKYFDSVDDWSVESAKAWEQYLQEMVCKVFVV